MNKLSIVSPSLAAALLCITPLSFRQSTTNRLALSPVLNGAEAAELKTPPNRRAHRHMTRYYQQAYFDLWCGGPYVGGGWNGGSYWGGPWMELPCYGIPVAETPAPNSYWWDR